MSLREILSPPQWLIEEKGFDPEKINFFETILTIGNGYLGTRGSLEEGLAGEMAGTYLAGIFDDRDSKVNEIANTPNWLPLRIFCDGEILHPQTMRVVDFYRALDIRSGILYRLTRYEDNQGRRTLYESIRLASFANHHTYIIRASIRCENYSGNITVIGEIDGAVHNILERSHRNTADVEYGFTEPEFKWDSYANSSHIRVVDRGCESGDIYLAAKTRGTGYTLGYASALSMSEPLQMEYELAEARRVRKVLVFNAEKGKEYLIDKIVSIYTSRDLDQKNIREHTINNLVKEKERGFPALITAHQKAWADKWKSSDIIIKGDAQAQQAIRYNIYHLLISAHKSDEKASIGAKTLSGQGYKGHVFWDTEIFILPFYIYTQPEVAKALVMYRYHCLPQAKKNARKNGYQGAQYPWESADSGAEVTPRWNKDVYEGYYTGDEQIHVTAAVFYGVYLYYQVTSDLKFLLDYGLEIMFEICRFWASRFEYNKESDSYGLSAVIGPDEFHEHINNSSYTNRMAQWNLDKGIELYDLCKTEHGDSCSALIESLSLSENEIDEWRRISEKTCILYDKRSGLFEQFAGYFGLKDTPITDYTDQGLPLWPTDVDDYSSRFTQLIKQADIVLLLFILADEFDFATKKANFLYYEKRTMHKSSLSPSTYAIMGIEVDESHKALENFKRSVFADLHDNQRNTFWGIHAASTGGSWQCLVLGFGGLRIHKNRLTFKPWLPADWQEVIFKVQWHGDWIEVRITPSEVFFTLRTTAPNKTEEISVLEKHYLLESGQELKVSLSRQ